MLICIYGAESWIMTNQQPNVDFWQAHWKEKSNDTRCRSGINNNVFVAVLIATVTFSGPFTIQTSDANSAFFIFLYFDAAAFAASMLAVLYAITCSPYSGEVADKQMIVLTRMIYFAVYSCVGAFCAAIFLICQEASNNSPFVRVHSIIMTAVIGTLFVISLVPAFLWFFCDHRYIVMQNGVHVRRHN